MSVKPDKYNLDDKTGNPVVQGGTFNMSVTSWTVENTTAFNLTGRTLKAQIRERFDSKDSVLDFTTSITNATGGVFSISATTAQTVALDSNKRYVYDVNASLSDGTVDYLMRGFVQVLPRVTK